MYLMMIPKHAPACYVTEILLHGIPTRKTSTTSCRRLWITHLKPGHGQHVADVSLQTI